MLFEGVLLVLRECFQEIRWDHARCLFDQCKQSRRVRGAMDRLVEAPVGFPDAVLPCARRDIVCQPNAQELRPPGCDVRPPSGPLRRWRWHQ